MMAPDGEPASRSQGPAQKAGRPTWAIGLLALLLVGAAGLGTWWVRNEGSPGTAPGQSTPGQSTSPRVDGDGVPAAGVLPGSDPLPGASPSPQPPSGAPTRTGPAVNQTGPPVKGIKGSSVTDITAAWTKRWGKPVKDNGLGSYNLTLQPPPAGDLMKFLARATRTSAGAETYAVHCIYADDAPTDDRRVVQLLFDGCLSPALTGAEKTAVSAWLNAQDYGSDGEQEKQFPRFTALVQHHRETVQVSINGR